MLDALPTFDIGFWRTAALVFVGVGQTAFVLLYTTFPWYRSFLGRALFYKACTLAAIVDTYIVARVFGLTELDWLFVALYALMGTGVWVQFFAFLHVRRNGTQNKTNPREGLGSADQFPVREGR